MLNVCAHSQHMWVGVGWGRYEVSASPPCMLSHFVSPVPLPPTSTHLLPHPMPSHAPCPPPNAYPLPMLHLLLHNPQVGKLREDNDAMLTELDQVTRVLEEKEGHHERLVAALGDREADAAKLMQDIMVAQAVGVVAGGEGRGGAAWC